MKTILAILLLALPAVAEEPCLLVYPRTDVMAPMPVIGMIPKTRYFYAGSQDLPISDVKVKYSMKDLQKMQKAGVKIVTVPAPDPGTVNVKVNRPAYDAAAVKEACQK